MATSGVSVDDHFTGRAPVVRDIYDALLRVSRKFGAVTEEPKKTSIHLVGGRSAFAGIATRKDALVLTIKSPSEIKSSRVAKGERVSANRWHLEVRLQSCADVDRELAAWLKRGYEMSS
jgi:hypothetical protein